MLTSHAPPIQVTSTFEKQLSELSSVVLSAEVDHGKKVLLLLLLLYNRVYSKLMTHTALGSYFRARPRGIGLPRGGACP